MQADYIAAYAKLHRLPKRRQPAPIAAPVRQACPQFRPYGCAGAAAAFAGAQSQRDPVFCAEKLEIAPITLTRIVDQIEKAEWIGQHSDPADRRARILDLSDKCRAIGDRLIAHVNAMTEDMLEGFDAGERAQFGALLDQIAADIVSTHQPEALYD
jgi:DNA-binding MarR family transcriptional regulator